MSTTYAKRLRSVWQPVGRWIRVNTRLAIYLRDGMACAYCGRSLIDADPEDNDILLGRVRYTYHQVKAGVVLVP